MTNQDPLAGAPDRARQLFEKIGQVADGFSAQDVMMTAINLLVNCVRQNRARRDDAAALYDEIAAKGRHVLLEQHYDLTGKRRNVFPSHQVIEVQPVVNLSKLKGL